MITNHFCGVLDISRTGERIASQACTDMLKRAATSLSANPAHVIERLEMPRLFIATCSFSRNADPIRRRQHGIGVVAGDPICCGEQESHSDLEASTDTVADSLLGGTSDGLSATRGSFAAAAWNSRTEVLALATDKLGIRPLYVALDDSLVVFGTTLKAVIRILGRRPAWDEMGLAQTMYFLQCFDERTAYSGVSCLSTGQILRIGPTTRPQRQRYFDLAAVAPREMPEDQIEVAVEQVFVRAVRRRARAPLEYAFLSGGLDSRLIVDTLLGTGRAVQTFASSYPKSLDDIVSAEAARHLGVEHVRHHRRPADALRLSMDSFALYAREGFPPMRKPGAKAMWSGDGGSVTLGHVYMTDRLVEATAQQPSAEIARVIYPGLAAAPSRHLGRAQVRRFQELAIESVMQELRRVSPARPDRRLFLFAMNNDQARHLYAHFEVLETAEIEFITPFFDPDFASLVAALPIKPFLRHAIYNRILALFHPRSAAFYWQEYPGHVPSPHPRPEGALEQWSKDWNRGSEACSARIQIADEILADRDAMSSGLLNPWLLRLTKLSDRLGLSRYSYEVDFARRIAALHHPDAAG